MRKKNAKCNDQLISVIKEISERLEALESDIADELSDEDSTEDLYECEKLALITERASIYSKMDPHEKAMVDYFERAKDRDCLELIHESMERIEKVLERIADSRDGKDIED